MNFSKFRFIRGMLIDWLECLLWRALLWARMLIQVYLKCLEFSKAYEVNYQIIKRTTYPCYQLITYQLKINYLMPTNNQWKPALSQNNGSIANKPNHIQVPYWYTQIRNCNHCRHQCNILLGNINNPTPPYLNLM